MRTIETQATVTPDGQLTVQLSVPSDIPPGEHRVVLVIDEHPAPVRFLKPPLALKVWKWEAWPAHCMFRREDLYGDEGYSFPAQPQC